MGQEGLLESDGDGGIVVEGYWWREWWRGGKLYFFFYLLIFLYSRNLSSRQNINLARVYEWKVYIVEHTYKYIFGERLNVFGRMGYEGGNGMMMVEVVEG